MTDKFIQQLKSDDSAKRREAIIALGKSGDMRAVRPLADVIKNDPDESLRALAFKAGHYLRGMTKTTISDAPEQRADARPSGVFDELPNIDALPLHPLPQDEGLDALTVPEPAPKPKKIASPQDKRLAKGRLEQAIGFKMQSNDVKCREALVKALQADPDLAKDVVALNLASNVTGIGKPDEAIQLLLKEAESLPTGGGLSGLFGGIFGRKST